MEEIDRIILLITRNKKKIKPIKRILAEKDNFEQVQDGTDGFYYKINSTSSTQTYKVFKNNKNEFFCDCIFNTKYIPYRLGEKKQKSKSECMHILSLRIFLTLTKTA